MGRKTALMSIEDDMAIAVLSLRGLRALDVKARKSRDKQRLKPKYTADIKTLDLLITTLVTARRILRSLPKAVQ